MGEYQRLEHEFEPIWDAESKILILGSFPSTKSRDHSFYYAHPQNRFWKVLGMVLQQEMPTDVAGRTDFLHRNHIAAWNVIQSCDIIGSYDSSIKNVEPTNLCNVIEHSKIQSIFVNGKTAEKVYQRYSEKKTGMKAIALPSTSSANTLFSLERLCEEWSVIRKYLEER